ncbi:glycosyltransferase family 4 protein [Jeotgalibaca porci]|uniref:Glycosyltransferase family 4 protein n=1 Tax=Jeotgalibaca porci TaxID=1868793 RepID=A0A6G7WG16_9LACT|nr:glycosyltransferase family 4 protein [Jeotgalibaca porci]QIK51235.1 glycosyltransferase family 4 protein [Jeotgalibaca porci]
MKKALMVTSVASMIKQFNIPNIKNLKKLGYEVTVATNFNIPGTIPLKESKELFNDLYKSDVIPINIEFDRNPISKKNFKAFKELKTIIKNGDFDLIHCQSPVGGVLTRLASRSAMKETTKIIYTAHGFHFYESAPKKNWIFYPIEKKLSRYTDLLITINEQDYNKALAFNTCQVEYVPGIGVDTEKFNMTSFNKKKREELGIPNSVFLIVSVGELNENKNHKVIIEAMHKLGKPDIHYAIIGIGQLKDELANLTDSYGLSKQVHFLGYRNDINEIYKTTNIFAFPSKREGLGLAAVEAMAAGLPLLTSNKHGINDYSIFGETGFKYEPDDIIGFSEGILKLYTLDKSEVFKIGQNNVIKSKKFDQEIVNQKMYDIYREM